MKDAQSHHVADKGPRSKPFGRNLLLGSLIAAGLAAVPMLVNAEDGAPKVKTAEGPVTGFTQNGVNTFLGIPYAAPPVGKLRWMPPQPVKKWKDALDATHYASSCPQVTELGVFAGPSSVNEDCLYLNVFTTGSSKKKPVLVWIYGGGNVDGESNDYDASKLATGGPNGKETVVVTLNYRMGLFGVLSEAHLNAEGHLWGNYGILDQQAVLRWVQRNAAAFGGDPTRVALGGQSAGAIDTGINQLSPLAQGLFNRAIYESGQTLYAGLPTASAVLSKGNAFASAAGCSDAKCMRGLSAERILQLQGTPNAGGPYTSQPFVDGTIVPSEPETAWINGRYSKMPILAGEVEDEGIFGAAGQEYFSGPPQVSLTPEQYLANNSAVALAQYPLSNYGNDPQVAQDRLTTDPQLCRALHVFKGFAATNKGNPVYAYDFTYQKAPFYFPQMPNAQSPTGHFRPLAAHTIDIQFLFTGYHGGQLGVNLDQDTGQPRELNNKETKLSDQLVAAWTNFAATGNPNGSGDTPWPKFKSSGEFLKEDIPLSTQTEAQYRAAYKCDFWDGQITYPM